MSHKGIRLLIEHTAKSLADNMQFDYGRKSDFNVLRDKKYPFISSDVLTKIPRFADNNVSNFSRTWTGELAFYQLDHESSSQEEYVLILDEMDIYVDRFIISLNQTDGIILTFGLQRPVIKATADILTGWILPVTIQEIDDFNYCEVVC